ARPPPTLFPPYLFIDPPILALGATRACRAQSVLRCTLFQRLRLPASIRRFSTPRLRPMAPRLRLYIPPRPQSQPLFHPLFHQPPSAIPVPNLSKLPATAAPVDSPYTDSASYWGT